MATFTASKITNKKYYPVATPHSSREIYTVTDKVAVTNALALNGLIKLAILPPNCLPDDILIYSTDIDSATSIVLDVGVLNDDEDDLVASSLLIDGSTIGQGGGVARMDDYEAVFEPATWLAETDCPDLHEEKIIAAKVVTAAGTPVAGTIYVRFRYRSAEGGI